MYSSEEYVIVCILIYGILVCSRKIFVLLSGKSSVCSLLNIVADDERLYQIIDNIMKFLKVSISRFLNKTVLHETEYLVQGLSQVSFHSLNVLI